jgi:hypothetical protein
VIGGGLSGLVSGYVLHQSGKYNVTLFEGNTRVGGHVRKIRDPDTIYNNNNNNNNNNNDDQDYYLNIGHATHMGMFANLRCMLHHWNLTETPVGRGPNAKPGLFRMLSVSTQGEMIQPPVRDVIQCMWEAFFFYFWSYRDPEISLGEFLQRHRFSDRFISILFWSMTTFEFDKTANECRKMAVGTARAWLITQIFFKYLLCDTFQGKLPPKMERSLLNDLCSRIPKDQRERQTNSQSLQDRRTLIEKLQSITKDGQDLASYFTADYTTAMNRLAAGIGTVRTCARARRITRAPRQRQIQVDTLDGTELFDSVVLTCSPASISLILDPKYFFEHHKVFISMECGIVGVQIVHEEDLPFSYPPSSRQGTASFNISRPPSSLGIFDISELTTNLDGTVVPAVSKPGWLSIAYPYYRNEMLNVHYDFLRRVPSASEAQYTWVRATSSYPALRRKLLELQGYNNIYVTGHALTGVNKASELQMTNALKLCRDSFGVTPPWGTFFPVPLLPDCNDDDAFRQAAGIWGAICLAWKSLLGSFLLVAVVEKLGADIFDESDLS